MNSFTTYVHIAGSTKNTDDDLVYLEKITQTVFASHAMVFRDWVEVARSQKEKHIRDDDIDWPHILNENIEALQKTDLVIIEATQARFSQGLQAYLAAQYKKPTLIVTRSETKNRFISGIANKYISIKPYKTEKELEAIVSKFIKQNAIPEKDLRFNFILDRRIYKYLRDKSYETGKNKSEIIRELLEREIKRRDT
jgi:hypothetical protein